MRERERAIATVTRQTYQNRFLKRAYFLRAGACEDAKVERKSLHAHHSLESWVVPRAQCAICGVWRSVRLDEVIETDDLICQAFDIDEEQGER